MVSKSRVSARLITLVQRLRCCVRCCVLPLSCWGSGSGSVFGFVLLLAARGRGRLRQRLFVKRAHTCMYYLLGMGVRACVPCRGFPLHGLSDFVGNGSFVIS